MKQYVSYDYRYRHACVSTLTLTHTCTCLFSGCSQTISDDGISLLNRPKCGSADAVPIHCMQCICRAMPVQLTQIATMDLTPCSSSSGIAFQNLARCNCCANQSFSYTAGRSLSTGNVSICSGVTSPPSRSSLLEICLKSASCMQVVQFVISRWAHTLPLCSSPHLFDTGRQGAPLHAPRLQSR